MRFVQDDSVCFREPLGGRNPVFWMLKRRYEAGQAAFAD
jgi:hypothetical protein